jgi:transposase InsO family protein|tara:strand:+ start:311 stop:514 length:204 start_codon:yes stop_codon:yes gene_type:complete
MSRRLTDGFHAERAIGAWIGFYNTERSYFVLGGGTPAEAIATGFLWLRWTRLAPCPHPHRLNKIPRT